MYKDAHPGQIYRLLISHSLEALRVFAAKAILAQDFNRRVSDSPELEKSRSRAKAMLTEMISGKKLVIGAEAVEEVPENKELSLVQRPQSVSRLERFRILVSRSNAEHIPFSQNDLIKLEDGDCAILNPSGIGAGLVTDWMCYQIKNRNKACEHYVDITRRSLADTKERERLYVTLQYEYERYNAYAYSIPAKSKIFMEKNELTSFFEEQLKRLKRDPFLRIDNSNHAMGLSLRKRGMPLAEAITFFDTNKGELIFTNESPKVVASLCAEVSEYCFIKVPLKVREINTDFYMNAIVFKNKGASNGEITLTISAITVSILNKKI